MKTLAIAFFCALALPFWAHSMPEAAFNIITYWPLGYRVDETPQGVRVRRLLQEIRSLGANTVIFNFRGKMIGGTSSDISPEVPLELQSQEEDLIKQTVQYARSLGLQVAFRPILLVVGPNGEFPYIENGFTWWHGNIRPTNPTEWFQKFFAYHQRYMNLAKAVNASWYSIGAEMHSMTSGLGSREPTWRFGYPDLWLQFIQQARDILGPEIKITYGVNYTDQYVLENDIKTWGGEFEQWHHDLTFQATTDEEIQHQQNMQKFWRALDFVGVDFYRALGNSTTDYPTDYASLVTMLNSFSIFYGQSLNTTMTDINTALGTQTALALQEVGYRSVDKCFVSPYLYEDDKAPINYEHQAAAWDSLLQGIWSPNYPWLRGIGIWQVLMDDDSDQTVNGGFSPLGKAETETVLKRYFIPAPEAHATHTNSVQGSNDLR